MNNKFKVFGLSCGMISSILYILHVLIGGLLWDGYSHIVQPISDLTSMGAPNRMLLLIITNLYGILAIVFATVFYLQIKIIKNKPLSFGILFLVIMEIISFVGYFLFPLEVAGVEVLTFQSMMHIFVTIIVVFTTIGFTLVTGIAFLRIQRTIKLGIFILICGVIIIVSGVATGAIIANGNPITGLIERINIFTLQAMIFIISYVMTRKIKIDGYLIFS